MIDPNWCFENPIEAAQEIQRLRELCEKAIEVADESQGWNWTDEDNLSTDIESDEDFNVPEMQSLLDDLEEIRDAL